MAAQNEYVIKNLRTALWVTTLASLALRFIVFRRSYSTLQYILVALPFVPSFGLYNYLTKLGGPVRDSSGTLVSSGTDLNQGGITEWAFDIIYITWACQTGSALLGEWFNFLYLIIPAFGVYKVWNLASPLLSQGGEVDEVKEPQSKRQQKLQRKADRGDPRVRQIKR